MNLLLSFCFQLSLDKTILPTASSATHDIFTEMEAAEEWRDRLVAGDLTAAEAAEAHDWVAVFVDYIVIGPHRSAAAASTQPA